MTVPVLTVPLGTSSNTTLGGTAVVNPVETDAPTTPLLLTA